MSERVIWCGGNNCVGRELCDIGDVEKPNVANLAAGAEMNAARSVFKDADFIMAML